MSSPPVRFYRARTTLSCRDPNWVAVGLVASLCLSLRMTSTGLLVASVPREGGRVVACRYFTGTRVVERQHAVGAGGAVRHVSCPLIGVR